MSFSISVTVKVSQCCCGNMTVSNDSSKRQKVVFFQQSKAKRREVGTSDEGEPSGDVCEIADGPMSF